jgi:predicted transcriptional regulator
MGMATRTKSVADVMTSNPIVVSVDASLEEADQLLRSTFIMGLPVVDGSGTLVGVISHTDLTAYRFVERSRQTRSKAIATEPPPPRQSVARP